MLSARIFAARLWHVGASLCLPFPFPLSTRSGGGVASHPPTLCTADESDAAADAPGVGDTLTAPSTPLARPALRARASRDAAAASMPTPTMRPVRSRAGALAAAEAEAAVVAGGSGA